MNRSQPPPANGPGRWVARGCLAILLAGSAAAQTADIRQTSVPVGIINQTTSAPVGAVASTMTAPETSGGYTFCYWTINAVRSADPGGTAQNPATFTMTGAMDAVAVYVPTTADTDNDGLPDWWEYRYIGNLVMNGNDDPDGDSITNAEEFARGLYPLVADLFDHGGISRRRAIVSVIQDPVHYVRLTELSDPPGAIQQTRIVPKGVAVTLTNPPTTVAGYTFTGWLQNGVRFDHPTDWQPISVIPTSDMTLVARYTPSTQDSDADGLLDWKELLWFESLQYTNASDPDGDGYTIAQEETRGFTSLAADELAQGGISRRRGAAIFVDSTGRLPFRLASDPATILDSTTYLAAGSLVTVPDKSGDTYGNLKFCWWDLNGVRQQDASGAALNSFSFTLNTPSTATAHYIDPNIDTDGDGIKDWYEWNYFGTLRYDLTSDPDGDGFTIAQELARGQAPQVADELARGGVSRRRSAAIFADTTGRLSYRTSSDPLTILSDQQFLPAGTVITVPDRAGDTYGGYLFCWWTLNGVRQQDASGVALSGFKFTLNTPAELVAHYIDPSVDTDGDGIKDWNEWNYYGTLAYGPNSDTDGDGFTYAQELARNQSPRVVDTLDPGGISRRRGMTVVINPVVLAGPPDVGELEATDITATTATISAHVNALSSATTANFEFGETPAFGYSVASVSILNGFIAASMAADLFNLQPDTLYYYRVNATNAIGTTTSITATFRTLGSRTNYDDWALIYSITDPLADNDGDGVPNLVEYAFGMNPRLSSDLWMLPAIQFIGGRLRASVTAPPGVNDVVYGAQWSDDMETWHAISDSGSGTTHVFFTPAGLIGSPRVFMRWAIRLAP